MEWPDELNLKLHAARALRYGENPHQEAALYLDPSSDRPGVARAQQVQGKELSYNNIADADAAFECVAEFSEPAVVIVKHMNPSGVAIASSDPKNPQGDALRVLRDTYLRALSCDPVSAFGGIVALNRELDAATAQELVKIFLEVVIAPTASDDAMKALAAKPNVRVLIAGDMPDPAKQERVVKSIAGGFLVQTSDCNMLAGELTTVTKRAPTEQEMADMKFAFTVCKHVKSNAIVYARGGATVGIGAGQMSRIYSAKLAALKASENLEASPLGLKGAVMASDAFMPFPDCVEAAAEAGATAIIQPGGSLKDQDSIDAADKHGMAMVFTGIRHFLH